MYVADHRKIWERIEKMELSKNTLGTGDMREYAAVRAYFQKILNV